MFRHARFILFSRVLMFALLACILVGLGSGPETISHERAV